jgi:hypothetical protein
MTETSVACVPGAPEPAVAVVVTAIALSVCR